MQQELIKQIFSIKNKDEFVSLCITIFSFQAKSNPVYKEFLHHLKIDPLKINMVDEIPFLPIEFFKSHQIISKSKSPEKVFFSSGTTGMTRSSHFVTDLSVYEQSFIAGFEKFYGSIKDYCILALLPSYFENESSSLIYMADHLIRLSGHPESGFYLNNHNDLIIQLKKLEDAGQKTILLGVSYALLDLAEKSPMKLNHTIIMETGGMKGRRKEMTRNELHSILTSGFGVKTIHSEYGMTELLSQAYSKGNGRFSCPPWMKVIIRDTYDPFTFLEAGKSGGINIIDLANINSCSFIETKDLGKLNTDGSFEVSGRFDNSDIRGCNLLITQ